MRDYRSPLQKMRRLLKVVEYLQSGRGFTARDLSEICGVTRRQIFRDLRALQDSGVPILYDSGKQAYWLPEPAFLPALELTLSEALSLVVLAASLGSRERGVPLMAPARDAALKLSNALPPGIRQHVGELVDLVEFHAEPAQTHAECDRYLDLLQQSLRERRRLRLRYNSLYEGREITTLLNPYRLLYARHSWYAVGRSSMHRAVRMFCLSRIVACELTRDKFEIPPRFSLERHLGNAWRLIREPGRRTRVHVRFQPLVAQNVAEVVWHKTQRVVRNSDGTIDFHVTVDGLREIAWWILGYGDQAEVISPPELREMIRQHVQNLHRTYGSRQRAKSATAPDPTLSGRTRSRAAASRKS